MEYSRSVIQLIKERSRAGVTASRGAGEARVLRFLRPLKGPFRGRAAS
jgi:hypothetical protein